MFDFSCILAIIEHMENTQKKNKLKTFWNFFTPYERIWFLSILTLSVLFTFLFPESDVNGTSGVIITILYVLDVVLSVACELLLAKQSRWGQFIYIAVDVIELIILLLINDRFMSMAVIIFCWFPMHLLSFLNWNKHKDKNDENVTEVRTLKKWQSIVMVISCIVGTFVFGYLVARFSPDTDFYSNKTIKKIVCYFDACVSIVSVFDGITMLLRYNETWLIWYIAVLLETVINILSGQWILLILKLGYLTNTTYGYIKWTKYIKHNKSDIKENVDNEQIQVDTKTQL